MRFLKFFLPSVYVVLILLLLLLNKDCSRETEGTEPQTIETNEDDLEQIADLGSGKMRFALRYDFVGDIDLHVITPGGVDINYTNLYDSVSSGELDHDEQDGGRGSKENIFFPTPTRGVYKAYLHHFSQGPNPSSERYECRLIVTKEGEAPKTYRFFLPEEGQESEYVEVSYP